MIFSVLAICSIVSVVWGLVRKSYRAPLGFLRLGGRVKTGEQFFQPSE